MHRQHFHYRLPPELIAQRPPRRRGEGRLLVLDGPSGQRRDARFSELPDLLDPGDLLVFNNTRVMRARLFGRKASGGRVEALIERLLDTHLALAHLRASKPPRPETRIELAPGIEVRVLERERDLWRLQSLSAPFDQLMAEQGHLPLPPYIQRPDDAEDEDRYQTVLASRTGAVAAPTAGLHFDHAMLERLAAAGIDRTEITLHVGAGTFQPVRVEDPRTHRMHAEWIEVDARVCERIAQARAAGRRVVAVGTTSVRSLETAAASGVLRPFRGDSDLFIYPGYRFRVVDAMVTNFHLPESTLLMLVSAFAGHAQVMAAYRHAVAESYRFFSYGDAMLLTRRHAAG